MCEKITGSGWELVETKKPLVITHIFDKKDGGKIFVEVERSDPDKEPDRIEIVEETF